MKKLTITKEQLMKFDRRFNRMEEIKDATGWVAVNKTHKSKKTYTRKKKHK